MDAADARRMKQLEKKVATLNILNSALKAENDELKDRIASQGASGPAPDAAELEELKEEFAERLASMENKLLGVTDDRDGLKFALRDKEDECSRLMGKIEDKEQTIAELQEEGENLARRIGGLEATTKKLRSDHRDEVAEKNRLGEQLDALKKSLKGDNLLFLGAEGGDAEAKLAFLSKELEAARRESKEVAATLRKDGEAAIARREAELTSRHEDAVRRLREKEFALATQVQQLQDSLVQLETSTSDREDVVRKENRFLQGKCQQLETRMADLSDSFAEQTKPYLVEMERLREAVTSAERKAEDAEGSMRAKAAEREERVRVLEGRLVAADAIRQSNEETLRKMKQHAEASQGELERQHAKLIQAVKRQGETQRALSEAQEAKATLERVIDEHEAARDELALRVQALEGEAQGLRLEGTQRERAAMAATAAGVAGGVGVEVGGIGGLGGAAASPTTRGVGADDASNDSDDAGGMLEGLLRGSDVKRLGLAAYANGVGGGMGGASEYALREQLEEAERMRMDAMREAERALGKGREVEHRYMLALELVGEKEEEVEGMRDRIECLEEQLGVSKALYRAHVDEKYAESS